MSILNNIGSIKGSVTEGIFLECINPETIEDWEGNITFYNTMESVDNLVDNNKECISVIGFCHSCNKVIKSNNFYTLTKATEINNIPLDGFEIILNCFSCYHSEVFDESHNFIGFDEVMI